jgi:hypothetical protein
LLKKTSDGSNLLESRDAADEQIIVAEVEQDETLFLIINSNMTGYDCLKMDKYFRYAPCVIQSKRIHLDQ